MNLKTFTVRPSIPEPLKPLEELAHNLWLSWNFDAVMLFIRLDYEKWIESNQNPVRLLGMVPQSRYEELAADDSYLSALNNVHQRFTDYLSGDAWFKGSHDDTIAYFSMEYGLDVSLPIYSGGLGVLSGDHVKTSSDLGLPLVAVGLLYREGYFQQYLNADGFQQESYPENDWYNMPVRRREDENGEPIKISVQMGLATVVAQIWEVKVGRTPLFLLDTNVDENAAEYREVTARLYGGDKENRMRQEILLGIGGFRALRALGIEPSVTHMNEGHSAFLVTERLRTLIAEQNLSTQEAMQAVWATSVFTSHTPVPAGNERFPIDLLQRYFDSIASGTGLAWHEFLALGREHPDDSQEPFCMTVLALRLSAYNNGVSELHGHVTREMWKDIWPGLPLHDIPIGHVTNGVHPRTFLSHDMVELLDRYFGPRFADEPTALNVWRRIDRITDEELWRTHERRKDRLVAFARDRVREQMKRRGVGNSHLLGADEVLSPYALTISFARRFATYKRATLLFRDPERLIRLLSDNERPVQIIFSGKAHPHDLPGKNFIRDIVHFASRPEVRSRIVFLENYDMTIAKYMVSGSDVWLNNPRRPMEASGTSGMKAAINGVLNCSTLDGWWAEAYNPGVGWAIGNGEEYEDEELQDEIESEALYNLLENDVIPSFYERGRDGLPREWIRRMKASISEVGEQFASHRMLTEYADRYYLPAIENSKAYSEKKHKRTRDTAGFVAKLGEQWPRLGVTSVSWTEKAVYRVGDSIEVEAAVELGDLSPQDVQVELYYGKLGSHGEVTDPKTVTMSPKKGAETQNGTVYGAKLTCEATGRQGYAVRILPNGDRVVHPFLPGLVKWG